MVYDIWRSSAHLQHSTEVGLPQHPNFVNINTSNSTLNVFKARRARDEPTWSALHGYAPYVVLWILVPTYLYLQPVVLKHHLVPFVLYVGLLNAYSVGQIIVAHLTKGDFPYQNILMLPLGFGVIDSLGPVLQERSGISWLGWPSSLGNGTYQISFVFMSLGIAIGVYGSFVVDVIVAICDYMDIWCLTIKHPWTEETEKKSRTKEIERERVVEQEGVETELDGTRSMRLRSASKKTR